MELQDLSNSQGLLPMYLGKARVIKTYNNLLHIIRLDTYKDNIDAIANCIEILNNTDGLYGSLKITKLKLEDVTSKLQTLLPRYRNKRGLIDGLGTIIKSITGNMDANDALRLNQEIESILQNQSILKGVTNQQSKINHNMIERFNNITNHINNQQKTIEEYLKHSQIQLNNQINTENNLIREIQYLNEINHNIDLLNNHLTNIAEAIMLARINIISKQILSTDELTEIYHILEGQSIYVKSDAHIYELLNLQAYYNDSNIIFNIQIPITLNENFSLFHLIPLPINKTRKIVLKPYAILNPENIQYFNTECPRIEETYYCKESSYHKRVNESKCIAKLLNNLPANCDLTEGVEITEIIQPEPNYLLLINVPDTIVESTCELSQPKVKGTLLIKFEGCQITINGITYSGKSSTYWDEIRIYPSTFHKINATSVKDELTLRKLKSYQFQNLHTIELLETKIYRKDSVMLGTFSFFVFITVTFIIWSYLKKRKARGDPKNNIINIHETVAPAEEPRKTRFLWPSLHLKGEELHNASSSSTSHMQPTVNIS